MLYGSDQKRFGSAADAAKLPEDKLDLCVDESAQNDKSWSRLFDPHRREDGNVAKPDTVSISYGPTEDYADDAAYLKKTGLLEDIGEFMRMNYKLKPGINIVGKECGEVNAYWVAATRTLEIC